MSDVSCRVFEYFDVAARDYDFSIEELVSGLDVSLDELRRPDNRVPWPLWATLCDRLCDRIGPEGLYDISVESANSAEDAWGQLLGREGAFDAILCDVMMPGTTGIEFHRRLAVEAPALAARTIFLTGGVFTPDSQAYLHQVARRCLLKPFRRSELHEVIAAVVEAAVE